MPKLLEMGTVITRCQRRADLEGDDHIADAEWRALIHEQYGELYALVAGTGMRYFEYTASYTTTGVAYVAEPADLLAFIGLDYLPGDGTRTALVEIMAQERTRVAGMSGNIARFYATIDDRIYLYPTPASGQSYELLYIPQPPDVSAFADDACLDVVTPDGEAFLVWGTVVKALAKSESDVRLAIAEREAARGRLLEWATMRAFNQPRRRVVEDAGVDLMSPYDWDPASRRFW